MADANSKAAQAAKLLIERAAKQAAVPVPSADCATGILIDRDSYDELVDRIRELETLASVFAIDGAIGELDESGVKDIAGIMNRLAQDAYRLAVLDHADNERVPR